MSSSADLRCCRESTDRHKHWRKDLWPLIPPHVPTRVQSWVNEVMVKPEQSNTLVLTTSSPIVLLTKGEGDEVCLFVKPVNIRTGCPILTNCGRTTIFVQNLALDYVWYIWIGAWSFLMFIFFVIRVYHWLQKRKQSVKFVTSSQNNASQANPNTSHLQVDGLHTKVDTHTHTYPMQTRTYLQQPYIIIICTFMFPRNLETCTNFFKIRLHVCKQSFSESSMGKQWSRAKNSAFEGS